MCGLIAIARWKGDLRKATGALLHRGIRSRTVEFNSTSSIGHVRLPIVGLDEKYDQPIDAGNWTLAFVGEILNFKEIDKSLECDLPLVARTWLNEGPKGFRKFEGFWSFAAMDRRTKDLHLLVDYLAQKPIYFRSDKHAVAAASEPDALVALGQVTLDPIYFSSVVKWGYCPETWRTPYLQITKLLPGEHIVLYPDHPPVRFGCVDTLKAKKAWPLDLKEAIEAAVERRVLSSDVPVAALVSGGLDSSIVYTIGERYGDLVPYHVENDENHYAKMIVGDRGARVCDPAEISVEKALLYMQEPIDLGSLLPQVALSEAIASRGGERVCLTGDGADEFFGGYGRALRYDSQSSDVFHELVAWHLPRLDRVMMRNRIEVRSPFLSREVAEIALGLPYEERKGKSILKTLFAGELPKEIIEAPKRALRTPEVAADREGWSRMLVEKFVNERRLP